MKLLSSRKIAAAADKRYASYASAVRVLKMNFLAIWRLKLQKISHWCPTWKHLMEIFN